MINYISKINFLQFSVAQRKVHHKKAKYEKEKKDIT